MKKIILSLISTLAFVLISVFAFSQAPQSIPYQAVARNASGNLMASQTVALRFTIHDSIATGLILFAESQTVTTNTLGLFSVNIGQGTTLVGLFSAINWGSKPKYVQVEMDVNGGTNYTNMGTTQLMSVPYALNAATSNDNKWAQTGGSISNTNTGNVGIGTTTPAAKLHISYASTPNCILESSSIAGTWLNLGNTSSNGKWFGLISTGSNSAMGPGKLLFSANNATQNIVSNIMVLDHTTGNVGIGNTSPLNKLSVSGGNVDFTGNVGIGTTTPSDKLTIQGGALSFNNPLNPVPYVGMDYDTTTDAMRIRTNVGAGTLNGTAITIKRGSGNVGIGTTSPSSKLDVNGDGKFGTSCRIGTNVQEGYFQNSQDGAYRALQTGGNQGYWFQNYAGAFTSMYVGLNGAYQGKVGIGTTTPSNNLSVNGHADFTGTVGIGASNTAGFNLLVAGNNNAMKLSGTGSFSSGGQLNFGDANYVYLKEDEDDKLTIQANRTALMGGNIGINTLNPQNPLSVSGNADFSGYVGIGTTAPTNNLSVIGNTNMTGSLGVGTDPTNAKLTVLGYSGSPFITSHTDPVLLRLAAGDTNTSIDFGIMNSGDNAGWIQAGFNYPWITQSLPLSLQPIGGKVGIGTTSPQAPLHIAGNGIYTPTLARIYFNGSSGITANTSSSGNIQVRADGYYWANGGGFVATSDKRIKNIIGQTNTESDLSTLNKIQITDYKYIDEASNGSKLQKKVIAQQLQEIYPDAVNINEGVIPNVFETAQQVITTENSTIITTNKKHDFKTGDMVRLILEKGAEKNLAVTVIDEHTFSVTEIINDNVFVYGKKVNDLLNVDYDAVAMLNVSATQELAKRVEILTKENEELKKINIGHTSEITELKSQMVSIKNDLYLFIKKNSTANK